MNILTPFMHFMARGIYRFFPRRESMTAAITWVSTNTFPVNTVIDVGASDGRWSRKCMKQFPAASYVLFEPNPVHAKPLDAFASSDQRVRVVKAAVADEIGEIFFSADDAFGGAIVRPSDATQKDLRVEVTTLDEGLSDASGPFLIKLDTHGFEKAILDGASDTLTKTNFLIIEAYNFRITDEAMMFWELCAYMSEKGFVVADVVDLLHRPLDGAFWQCDIVFVKNTWPGAQVNQFGP